MDVINLSLGEPEVEPTRDIVVTAIDGAAAAGVVPVIAAGNDFDEFGYGSVSSPGNAPGAITVAAVSVERRRSPTSPRPARRPSRCAEARRLGAGRRDPLVAARRQAARGAARAARAWRRRTSPARRRCSKQRHPTWTVAADQVGARPDRRSRPRRRRRRGARRLREGGGLVEPRPRRQPAALRRADRALVRRLAERRRHAAVALTDAGGGAGDWAVSVAPSSPAAASPSRAADRDRARASLAVTATAGDVGRATSPASSSSRAAPTCAASRSSSTSTIPLLAARDAARRSPRPGTYSGTTNGRARRGSASTATRPAATRRYPGPEVVYRVTITGRPANFGVVVTLRAARSRTSSSPATRITSPATPACRSTSTRTVDLRRCALDRRRGPAGRRALRPRLRHPLEPQRRARSRSATG